MLKAGPSLDPAKDLKEHLWPYDRPHRGAGIGGKLKGEDPTSSWRRMAPGKSKVSLRSRHQGSTFRWFRSRVGAGGDGAILASVRISVGAVPDGESVETKLSTTKEPLA